MIHVVEPGLLLPALSALGALSLGALAMAMGFSEKDGQITVTANQNGLQVPRTLKSFTGPEFDPGDTYQQVLANGHVAFIAHGARKPVFKFNMPNGVEANDLRDLCVYDQGGGILGYWPCVISWAFRRPGLGSIAWHLEGDLGKGGGFKASDGPGLEGGAFEFALTTARVSKNGAPFKLTA